MEPLLTFAANFHDAFVLAITALVSLTGEVWSAVIGGSLIMLTFGVVKHNPTYAALREWLRAPGIRPRYEHGLAVSLNAADWFFGPDKSFHAFSRCLTIALVYPGVLLLASWIGGVSPNIATTPLFDTKTIGWSTRLGYSSALVLIVLFCYVCMQGYRHISEWIWERAFGQRANNEPLYILLETIALSLPAGVSVGVAVIVAGAENAVAGIAFVFAFIAAGAIRVSGITAVPVAGFGALTFAVAFAFAGAIAGSPELAIVIIFLYATLPLANAGFDWISWLVTRRLLGSLLSARSTLNIVGHAGIDLVLAILFLMTLAIVLPFIAELTNAIFAALGAPQLRWRALMQSAAEDPFGGGIMITGMLLTTLVPTVLHLGMALVAFLFPRLDTREPGLWYPFRRHLSRWINSRQTDPNYFQRIGVAIWLLGTFALSGLVMLIIATALYSLISAFGPTLGQLLLSFANFGASLAGG